MNRLIEKTVFSGLVIACRLATCPTRISPSFVNPTTDGVSRLPSWFAMTVGLPPSTTETTEVVLRGVHVHGWRPYPPARGRRTTNEAVEEAVHLAVDVRDTKRLPPVQGRKPERTPMLHRHWKPPPWFFAGSSGRLPILST